MKERDLDKKSILSDFWNSFKDFSKKDPEEAKLLYKKLLDWFSSDEITKTSQDSLDDLLFSQLNTDVKKMSETDYPITLSQYVDFLFSLDPKGEINANTIMARINLPLEQCCVLNNTSTN